MKNKSAIKGVATTTILGTSAILQTVAFLGPLQVCGAATNQTESFITETSKSAEAYNWDIQMVNNYASEDYLKEGTPTGSTPGNSLEDWND